MNMLFQVTNRLCADKYTVCFSHLKYYEVEPWGMARHLGTFATPVEDQRSVPSTSDSSHPPVTPVSENLMPSSDP